MRSVMLRLAVAFLLSAVAGNAFGEVRYTITNLGTPDGRRESAAFGINSSGQVVGYAYPSGIPSYQHAFRYNGSTMTDLGTLGGSDTSTSEAHAFLYSDGNMVDLETFGGNYSFAKSINDRGEVVGFANLAGNASYHSFLYSNGTMTDLGTFGGAYSGANDINEKGQVVGYSQAPGNIAHAFLYDNGVMMDLNNLIDPALGLTLYGANAITESGQIVAYGEFSGKSNNHAFLLTPIPEPSTLCLLAIGLLSYAWRRRVLSRRMLVCLAIAVLALSSAVAQADVLNMGGTRDATTGTWTGAASLEFVTVGDPGNVADTRQMTDGTTGYGSVASVYKMGKYDVTVGQYCEFLNAVAKTDTYGLFNSRMATDFSTIKIIRSGSSGNYTYSVAGSYEQGVNCPVFDVSWGDAARFCNWLQNGQPSGNQGVGTTETGAYTMNGGTSTSALLAITRNPVATFFIPSENEWYKAAHYKGGSTNAGYWNYTTQSDTRPSNVLLSTGDNNANYDDYDWINKIDHFTDPVNFLTPVGVFNGSEGTYGTYDMSGNVFQWNEAILYSSTRGVRGNSYDDISQLVDLLAANARGCYSPTADAHWIGFRVASVPEPSTLVLLGIAAIGLSGYWWRRRGISQQVVTTLAAVVVVLSVAGAQADVFNMGGTRDSATGTWTGQASLEFVTVSDPGNAADTTVMTDGTTGYGSVGYTFQIGKYDVTAAQYTQFLNAVAKTDPYGLYNSRMVPSQSQSCGITQSGTSGNYTYSVRPASANFPVNFVSWGSAARFCNWLQNGQPTGPESDATTETGAYALNGAVTNSALMAITRNAGAKYVIPSEDEWYKAAYYKGGGVDAGYWLYPTCSDTAPINTLPDTGNHANFVDKYGTGNHGWTNLPDYVTSVGEFALSSGPYGTYDQGGDVWQWNETSIAGSNRGMRGGAYNYWSDNLLSSYRGVSEPPTWVVYAGLGFRVAEVPEPGTLVMMLVGSASILAYAWRRGMP